MNHTRLTPLTKSSIRKAKLNERDKERIILALEGENAHLRAIIAAQEAFITAITLGQCDFVDGNGEIVRAIGVVKP
jgi:hypothetical protein